jgi:dienelactone hydrolase
MGRARLKCAVCFASVVAVLLSAALGAADAAAFPWDFEKLSKPPATYPAPGFEAKGARALFYDGLPYKGKPTRIFAWYGKPEKAPPAGKFPAMVLIHGGGGTAFDNWVRLWNERGYAAISMDTCGCTSGGAHGKRPRHEYGGPPGWGGFVQVSDPVADQWTWHAVADAILAHSLIRSFPEVDPERIGVTGISWGGYLTCIVSGVDTRFKFAVPVYGCGFLGENSFWTDKDLKGLGPERAAQWLKLWDPSVYLKQTRMPMLWVTGTNDFAYPMDSLQKSYRLPQAPRTLTLKIRMAHGHGPPGENPEEIRAFADSFLKNGKPFAQITAQGKTGNEVWAEFKSGVPVVKAELNYTKDGGKWQERKWETAPAALDGAKHRASAALPDGAKVYYLNLTDERNLVVSTEHGEQ